MITGASSGFGLALTKASLGRGHTVVACARRPAAATELREIESDRLEVVELDLAEAERIELVVARVIEAHGGVDVLVNNAGRGLFGAAEEIEEQALRQLMELHFFAPARLTRAVLPHMRVAASGFIVQMSSQAGRFSEPGLGGYSATKFALEGWSEALAAEVEPLGIGVLIVEPGPFRTSFYAPGSMDLAPRLDAYEPLLAAARSALRAGAVVPSGNPAAAAEIICEVLDDEDAPLRLALGAEAVERISLACERASDELARWDKVSRLADRPDGESGCRSRS